MTDTLFSLDEEPRRQLFWVARPFTPFQKGTPDFEEWNGWFTDNAELGEILSSIQIVPLRISNAFQQPAKVQS